MLSLGIPELLVLLAAVLMGYGSWRIPQLIRSADESRRSFQSGARLPTDQPGEPVGITLRQIQFRGSVPHHAPPAEPALQEEPVDNEEAKTEAEVVGESGARRVPVSSGPVDSAGIDGWEDIFV